MYHKEKSQFTHQNPSGYQQKSNDCREKGLENTTKQSEQIEKKTGRRSGRFEMKSKGK